MEIKNKVIIITGASYGIGLAAAKLLSTKGATLVLAARSSDILKKIEKEIPNSYAIITDMRKPSDIEDLVSKTMERFGRIDILINNAGQAVYGAVEKVDIEDYRYQEQFLSYMQIITLW